MKAINIFNNGSEIYSQIDLLDGNLVKQCKEYKKAVDSVIESEKYFQVTRELLSKINQSCAKEIIEAAV